VLGLLVETGELERAREEAYSYSAKARAALSIFADSPYRRALAEIAGYIVERDR
jgi:geranylgeranyl pyrophosphate synthase